MEYAILKIRELLESDRKRRKLERKSHTSPDAIFRQAMMKLKTRRHLGQLTMGHWKSLIDGANLHGYLVYLATPSDKDKDWVHLKELTTDYMDNLLVAYGTTITRHAT
ncbi:MAG: hypothetical protein ACXABY_18370, partial [Candidatus Thorarchaeota archaeon]